MYWKKITFLTYVLFWFCVIVLTLNSKAIAEWKVLYVILESMFFMFCYRWFMMEDWD